LGSERAFITLMKSLIKNRPINSFLGIYNSND